MKRRTQKIQKMTKSGTQVQHLLIQSQRKKKGNRLCWPQDSLKSKKSSGTSGYSGNSRTPLIILKVGVASVESFQVIGGNCFLFTEGSQSSILVG